MYEATLNAFGGIKNVGSLFAIVFAKGNTATQLRILEQLARMSTKVTEVGLADQSYEDMSEKDLLAEIERKSKAAKMPGVANALLESMSKQNKAIEDQKAGIIDVDHEVKNDK